MGLKRYSLVLGLVLIIALALVGTVVAQTTITGVTISGTPAVGNVLTAEVTPSGSATSYQWLEEIGGSTTERIIPDNADTYTPVTGDVGYNIWVIASNSDSSATSPRVGPVLASKVTVDTAAELETNVSNPVQGEIIILEPGTYYANDMTVGNDKIIEADTANGHGPWDTIIDGSDSGNSIFTDSSGYSLAIDNLTIQNGVSSGSNGGAIDTYGGVTVTSSTFIGCSASYGGAINAISITVNSSTFTGCSASYGGAINAGIGTIHFCRIYPDSGGAAVYNGNDFGIIDATDNWWGTNSNPSAYVNNGVTYSPWLVLGVTASPASIATGQASVIKANLTYNRTDSGISYDASRLGLVPDDIPVTFSSTGIGSVFPHKTITDSGASLTVLSPTSTGTAYITATVDGQSVTVPVIVTPATTTVNTTSIAIDPKTPSNVYAGLDGVGIYYSTTSGGSWTEATRQPGNTNISAIVIDPIDSTHLFAATNGGGVFQSTDSAATWNTCTAEPAQNVISLVANTTGALYAGTEAGVYISVDNCTTWNAMNNGLP
jgi:hypothetical protein